jgi:hypothetical protein
MYPCKYNILHGNFCPLASNESHVLILGFVGQAFLKESCPPIRISIYFNNIFCFEVVELVESEEALSQGGSPSGLPKSIQPPG